MFCVFSCMVVYTVVERYTDIHMRFMRAEENYVFLLGSRKIKVRKGSLNLTSRGS